MSEVSSSTPIGAASTGRASVRVAIADAARRTETDFDFLLAQAKIESGLDSGARAKTSSATGLYQFIESTWLETMRRHGSKFGMGEFASQISASGSGPKVSDPLARANILSLRNDPQISSLMAGALAQDNGEVLRPILNRAPDASELYLAHFLGSGGAAKFLTQLEADPERSAADVFPRPARANRAIFFESDGSPRSLGQVMDVIRTKISSAMEVSNDPGDIAGSQNAQPSVISGGAGAGFQSVARANAFPSRPPAGDGAHGTPSMSSLLRDNFAFSQQGPSAGSEHVRKAYARLQAFGL